MLRRPISAKSWRIVVSGGSRNAVSGRSSKPTTLTFPGTDLPDAWRAWRTPMAIWSLPQKMAVTDLSAMRSSPARYPDAALQSPVRA